MTLVDGLALVVSAAGLAAPLLAGLTLARPSAGVGVMLELWTAAALLRLTADSSAPTLLWTAVIVAVRGLMLSRTRGRFLPARRRGSAR